MFLLLLRPWPYKSYWILGRTLGRKVVTISPVIPFGFCPASLRKPILGGGGFYSLIFQGGSVSKGGGKNAKACIYFRIGRLNMGELI